jgi:transcriptional regulator GlxA family with amidase domain
VLLLQAAGVLPGKTVTISWWLASHLRSTQPDCTVDAHRMVVVDGNIITAGAALAHTDLMLQLLRMHCGAALADVVSRVLVIDCRAAQAQYVIPSALASGNALVAQLSATIEAALPKVPSVRDLAQQMCISERTLARHVVAATGLPPLALVQHVRLARARALLEKSRLSVEQVAEKVGYSDATALRRMMKKSMNATPRQLRTGVYA